MAFDRESLRVDWLFRIAGTAEIAMTGLSVTGPAPYPAATALAAFDEATHGGPLYNAMATLMTSGSVLWADYSELTTVRVSAVDVSGNQIGDPKIFTPATVDNGAYGVLPQATVVLSLRTATTLGQANYGRMYLPHSQMQLIVATPFAQTSAVVAVSIAGANFIDDVNTVFGAFLVPGQVFNMSAVGAGTSKAITRVAVGNITDTQRRRRNRLPETYSFTDVT